MSRRSASPSPASFSPVSLSSFAVLVVLLGFVAPPSAARAEGSLDARIEALITESEPRVVAWRRDIHQNPELGNREIRTAALVAEHLRSLGMEVRTEVAHTGVIGVLRGGKSGTSSPVVALRADMDALPVTEQVDLPFASKVRTEYNGEEVGVMHACGHDVHVSVLMGVAEVLAGLREELPGTVLFLFQPAEEGAPAGEEGGADLMLKEGAFADPRPDVVFGLHAMPQAEAGFIGYRAGGALASSDGLRITVRGKQTHAAMPWQGVDPITVSSQIILALQTITSRQLNATVAPAVISIGSIHGGVRGNIIPDEVELWGTIRTLDPEMQKDVHERVRRTATAIAESAGATAEVEIDLGYPVTYNDPALVSRMAPSLERALEPGKLLPVPPILGAEDFSYFAQEVPGFFFFLGVRTPGAPPESAAANHSPHFFAHEDALPVGVRALTFLAVDYLTGAGE